MPLGQIIIFATAILLVIGLLLLVSRNTRKLGLKIVRVVSLFTIVGGLAIVVIDMLFSTEWRGFAAAVIGLPALGVGIVLFIVCHFISKKINQL